MNVVCDFTNVPSLSMDGGASDTLTCFLPVMGKPFLHHVLGYVARLGAKSLAIFVSDHAEQFEQSIGDGERWGVRTTYHLVKKDVSVRQRIAKTSPFAGEESLLICNALYLPCLKETHLEQHARFVTEQGDETGWFYSLASEAEKPLHPCALEALCMTDPKAYLQTLNRVLTRKGGSLIVMGKELREGVWVGAGSKIHTSCTIIAPVYIGSQVNLGEGCVVGPHCEIGDGCIIDEGSSIINSSVLSGSYVGKNLEVRGCVVNQNTFFNVALQSAYVASDTILASSVENEGESENTLRVHIGSRLIALVLALVTSPLLLLVLLVNRLFLHRRIQHLDVVCMHQKPVDPTLKTIKTIQLSVLRLRTEKKGSVRWHALWVLLPGLWKVALGKSRFCGVPYRRPADLAKLSKEWQTLYFSSQPGIITEADILYTGYPEEEMLFASEMYYHVVDSFAYNAKLILRYLKGLFSVAGSPNP